MNNPDQALDENKLIAQRREKLRALRAEFALKAQASAAAAAQVR